MRRLIFTLAIFLAWIIAHGQTLPDTLARLNNPKAFVLYSSYNNKTYLQYKNKQNTDTINIIPFRDSCWLEAKGNSEIILYYQHPEDCGPDFTYNKLFHSTCWNIETKKVVFDVLYLGKLESPRIKAITTNSCYSGKSFGYLLLENKGGNDTIIFGEFDDNLSFEDFSIQAKQLDNKGKPEIIIEYRRSFYNQGVAGGASTSIITQVWNLDTKKKLFEATNYNMYAGCDRTDTTDNACWGCEYSYKIQFTNSGQLMINSLIVKADNDPCPVDKKEGTYSLFKEEYILTKEK